MPFLPPNQQHQSTEGYYGKICGTFKHTHTHTRTRTRTCTRTRTHTHTHTHTRLTALFPGLLGWASTRKVKLIWILLKQETVSSSGISWAICKSASHSRQITMPVPHHSSFLQAGCPSCRPTNSVKALKAQDSRRTRQPNKENIVYHSYRRKLIYNGHIEYKNTGINSIHIKNVG